VTKPRAINQHWLAIGITLLALACMIFAIIIRADFFYIVLAAILTVMMAWQFHTFSPFWYHLRTGIMWTNRDRPVEADRHFQRALSLAHNYSADDFRRGVILLALADARRAQAQAREAERYYLEALPVLQQHENKHFLELLVALNNLGTVYFHLGKYVEAEIYYRQALSLAEKRLGRRHWLSGLAAQNLAGLYLEVRQLDVAEEYLEDAEESGRKNAVLHLFIQGRWARLYLRRGNLTRADSFARDIRSRLEKLPQLGPQEASAFLVLTSEVFRRQGKLDEAEEEALRAMQIAQSDDRFPASRTRALANLAAVLLTQGKLAEGESLFHQALALHQDASLPDRLDWAEHLEELAELFRQHNRHAEAGDCELRARNIRQHVTMHQAAPRARDERVLSARRGSGQEV
jgi:tetratricopeptide (TPR) repeat protein